LNENQGVFPPDMVTLATAEAFDLPVVGSPGRPARFGRNTPTGTWYGYVLIDWSTQPRGADWGSGKYPLIYDASLGNHEGRGIHIILSDHTIMWDLRATWLKQFAAQHPSAVIPIPQ
jgi:hypothetical protein